MKRPIANLAMIYKSIATEIAFSCYSCHFFEVSKDKLNGTCYLSAHDEGKSAIGLGTCDGFTKKENYEFTWNQLIN